VTSMAGFLLLTLYAPLASWGDLTVGETRSSWDRPSRSALLGLLAAALGVERTNQPAHDALDAGYGYAVRLDAPGVPVIDYHTAQTVAESVLKKRRPATRKELLQNPERETILSRRAYRADALATVVIWANEGAAWPLGVLRDAIRNPAFVLYAGRKSNPFALPLNPELVEAESLVDAFAARPPDKAAAIIELRSHYRAEASGEWGREISYDTTLPVALRPAEALVLRRETRRDTSPDRRRWLFAERTVEVARLPDPREQKP
jgi:CRISPR system Cascade subunit CasD